jgi:hypothetical protein
LKCKGLSTEDQALTGAALEEVNTSSSSLEPDSDEELKKLWQRQKSEEESRNIFSEDEEEMELLSQGGGPCPGPSRVPTPKRQKISSSDSANAEGRDLTPPEVVRKQISNSLDIIAKNRSALRKAKMPIWELINKQFPEELKEVALLLVGMPPTQVSVERLFSSLRILKTDHRNRLGEGILNAMMFLRSNL